MRATSREACGSENCLREHTGWCVCCRTCYGLSQHNSYSSKRKITYNNVVYSGTNAQPVFIYIDDHEVTSFKQQDFENKMQMYIRGARAYWRDALPSLQPPKANIDALLHTKIYQLQLDDTSTPVIPKK